MTLRFKDSPDRAQKPKRIALRKLGREGAVEQPICINRDCSRRIPANATVCPYCDTKQVP